MMQTTQQGQNPPDSSVETYSVFTDVVPVHELIAGPHMLRVDNEGITWMQRGGSR